MARTDEIVSRRTMKTILHTMTLSDISSFYTLVSFFFFLHQCIPTFSVSLSFILFGYPVILYSCPSRILSYSRIEDIGQTNSRPRKAVPTGHGLVWPTID